MTKEREITVLGAAKSGIGAAVLAKKEGLNVFVSDYGKIKTEYKNLMDDLNIEWEENGHSSNRILQSAEVVKSPGIPNDVKIVKDLHVKNISVISEIEFASRYTNAKIIAITGTNGKTTTSYLIYHILKSSGLNVGLAGNLGISFSETICQREYEYYVLEVSSFQL